MVIIIVIVIGITIVIVKVIVIAIVIVIGYKSLVISHKSRSYGICTSNDHKSLVQIMVISHFNILSPR